MNEDCTRAYAASVTIYHSSVAASVLLALVSLSLRHVCLRPLLGAPDLASQFYIVVGSLQLLVGVLDLTLFVPHCPEDCVSLAVCSNRYKPAYFIYPLLATLLGGLLVQEGVRHGKTARAVNRGLSEQEGGEPVAFARIPMTELA
jgi:hypothetical protein